MTIFERITRLVSANINHLLDRAEDPEVMIKQLIRDMEENIIELRRETVRAVARVKQVQKQIESSHEMIAELEQSASLALKKDEEELARKALSKKLNAEKSLDLLEKELQASLANAEHLKGELTHLEDRVQEARRKKEELIARNRAAESRMRAQEALKRSSDTIRSTEAPLSDLDSDDGPIQAFEEKILRTEAEAAALKEVLQNDIRRELDLQKLAEDHAIEEELERLKRELKS